MARLIEYKEMSRLSNFCFYQFTENNPLTALDIIFCRPIDITLFPKEIVALKLHNIDDISQIEVAKKMGISQPTVARILKRAYKKVVTALLEGKVIRIKNIYPSKTEKFTVDALIAMQSIEA